MYETACVQLTEITVLTVKIYHRKESEDQNVEFSALGSVLYFAAQAHHS